MTPNIFKCIHNFNGFTVMTSVLIKILRSLKLQQGAKNNVYGIFCDRKHNGDKQGSV